MERSPLDRLRLTATDPVDLAYQLGRARRDQIERRVEYWDRFLAKKFKGRGADLRELEKRFLEEATAGAPAYVEEIRAIASGAWLSFSDLFRLNLTELHTYAEKCTTLAFRFRSPAGPRILLAHNEDWDPRRNDIFLLEARLPEVSFKIIAYDGYLPGLSSGVNSHGLGHAINYLLPPDRRVGLPRIFITRRLVTARNFREVLDWIRQNRRAFGQGIHLAQGSRYLALELTARRCVVRNPSLPTVHTNHYLSPTLAPISQISKAAPLAKRPGPSSLARYEVARRLLTEIRRDHGRAAWTRAEAARAARRILSDRSGLPYAIWREADRPEDPGATLAMALIDTESLEMEVSRVRPLSTT